MHRIYCFLLPEGIHQYEIEGEFHSAFDECLEEDNYFEHLGFVRKNGEVRSLPLNKRAERISSWMKHFSSLCKNERWDSAYHFTYQCVVAEMGRSIVSGGLPSDPLYPVDPEGAEEWIKAQDVALLKKAILARVPAHLAVQFREKMDEVPAPGNWHPTYELKKLTQTYFLYHDSCIDGREPFASPESDNANPYTYRAFNLCGTKEPGMILFTDIHT